VQRCFNSHGARVARVSITPISEPSNHRPGTGRVGTFLAGFCPVGVSRCDDSHELRSVVKSGPADVRRAHPGGDETIFERYAMKRFLRSVFGVQPSPTRTRRVRLAVEGLDERSLCSAIGTDTLAGATSGPTDTVLAVEIPWLWKVRDAATRQEVSRSLLGIL